ncbi:hypothetical protein [Pseudomonas mangrovi]|uniref:Uncharacterized protein n=1 Tax=Pseudomonas mangrovi TaxID=2161748 RepID=A0A2T5PDF5_9PSED|nr:hypothetical protein [Pseudomonas mangrovi]PTU75768.1 hypothetical protein DBO85_03600 [Pseudomonas mangrovi]
MDINVYRAPESDLQIPDTRVSDKLVKVAARQRALIFGVLAQIFLNPIAKAIGIKGESAVIILGVLSLILMIYILVTAVRLSMLLNHVAITVMMGLFSIIPLINLIVLLVLSRQSTKLLRSHGVRVGLLGANVKKGTSPAPGVLAKHE